MCATRQLMDRLNGYLAFGRQRIHRIVMLFANLFIEFVEWQFFGFEFPGDT